jgi:hypothetical protein
MLKGLIVVLPVIAAAVALWLRHLFLVRVGAVCVIGLVFLIAYGGLLAPHRLAEETVPRVAQNSDWVRGALATRDVVHSVTPLVISCLAASLLLALWPVRPAPRVRSTGAPLPPPTAGLDDHRQSGSAGAQGASERRLPVNPG